MSTLGKLQVIVIYRRTHVRTKKNSFNETSVNLAGVLFRFGSWKHLCPMDRCLLRESGSEIKRSCCLRYDLERPAWWNESNHKQRFNVKLYTIKLCKKTTSQQDEIRQSPKNAQVSDYILVYGKSSFHICLCETPVAHMWLNIGCLSL